MHLLNLSATNNEFWSVNCIYIGFQFISMKPPRDAFKRRPSVTAFWQKIRLNRTEGKMENMPNAYCKNKQMEMDVATNDKKKIVWLCQWK